LGFNFTKSSKAYLVAVVHNEQVEDWDKWFCNLSGTHGCTIGLSCGDAWTGLSHEIIAEDKTSDSEDDMPKSRS